MICSLFFARYSDDETRSVRVAGNVTLFAEVRNTYEVLAGKLEGKMIL